MLLSERRQKIVDYLRIQGNVTVTELSEMLEVSEETIRRDLQQLETEKKLKRVHGGAYIDSVVGQVLPADVRRETLTLEKEVIADICLGMIENGNTIMLDTSTTAFYIAKKLKRFKNLIVISNSLDIIYLLANEPSIQVISCGSFLERKYMSFIDLKALETVDHYNADICFVSCTGISIENGLTDSNDMQGKIRAKMLKNSKVKVCIADNTKFNKTTLANISAINDIEYLVTNEKPSKKWKEYLDKCNVKLLYS